MFLPSYRLLLFFALCAPFRKARKKYHIKKTCGNTKYSFQILISFINRKQNYPNQVSSIWKASSSLKLVPGFDECLGDFSHRARLVWTTFFSQIICQYYSFSQLLWCISQNRTVILKATCSIFILLRLSCTSRKAVSHFFQPVENALINLWKSLCTVFYFFLPFLLLMSCWQSPQPKQHLSKSLNMQICHNMLGIFP